VNCAPWCIEIGWRPDFPPMAAQAVRGRTCRGVYAWGPGDTSRASLFFPQRGDVGKLIPARLWNERGSGEYSPTPGASLRGVRTTLLPCMSNPSARESRGVVPKRLTRDGGS
jgi:hypothetical protein